MARLAAAMGVRNEDMLVAGLDMPPLTDDQLDYQPPPALLTRLVERTNVPLDALRAMTVEGYVPLLIDRLTPTPDLMQTSAGQYWFFVMPEGREPQRSQALGPWHEQAQRHRRTCPLCLRDEARSYRRIYGR